MVTHSTEAKTLWRILPHRSPRAVEDLRDSLVIRQGGFAFLTDRDGTIPPGNAKGLGLYFEDTRYLSGWGFDVDGVELLPVVSTADLGFAMEQVFICPELVNERDEVLPAGSVQIRRQRVLDGALVENLRFSNFSDVPITLRVAFRFAADFADIFEVRGLIRNARGTIAPVQVQPNGITLRYHGLDGKGRETRIIFKPVPEFTDLSSAQFRVAIPTRSTAQLTATVLADSISGSVSVRRSVASFAAAQSAWRADSTQLVTDNEVINTALNRALNDVHLLLSRRQDLRYVAAGVPWFNTLFGRDSALCALMLLPFSPTIARDTLRTLALLQGRVTVPEREEEPGKIVHEVRECEMARTGEVPFERYYGSIDSTALYLLLAAEYFRWTGDIRLMQEIEAVIAAGLEWIDQYGDMDGDGLLEYKKKSPIGLDNQGWKDSHDAIIHEDGIFLEPPIALVEVQGYVYAAKRELASVYEALRRPDVASRLRMDADLLRRRVNVDFWLEDMGFYAMALDADKRPSRVPASNGGQLLWSGLPTLEKGHRQARRLFRRDMFSGWGIRTLSDSSRRYNPMGYHLGTVWPHDNALIVAGLHRYGATSLAHRLTGSLFEAAGGFEGQRLPELFSGSPRLAHHGPVPYPVACRPQAFAAASLPYTLVSLLGIVPHADQRVLDVVRPHLPPNVNRLRLSGMRVGASLIDLEFERLGGGVKMNIRRHGLLKVRRVTNWPHE